MGAELAGLVAAQERDAQSFRVHSLSLDAFTSGADIVHRRSRKLVTDPKHGTLNCYIHYGCRCAKCKAASAEAKREQRRRQRVTRHLVGYRNCCQECGSYNVKREAVFGDAA